MFYDHTLGGVGVGCDTRSWCGFALKPDANLVLPRLVNRPKIVRLHRQWAHLSVLPVLAIFYFVGWLLAIQFFFGILRKFISFILSKPKSSLFRQPVPFQVR